MAELDVLEKLLEDQCWSGSVREDIINVVGSVRKRTAEKVQELLVRKEVESQTPNSTIKAPLSARSEQVGVQAVPCPVCL